MLLERAVFKMYIMDSCPYCDKARDIILNEERASLHTINISSDPNLRKMILREENQILKQEIMRLRRSL